MKITKVYTKGGDKGQTSLVGGQRVSKSSVRLEAYGTIDELSSHLGLLASQGIDRLPVFRRPRAVLIPTGTELFEPGQERSSHGIYNSSSFTLSAAMKKMGLEIFRRDIVPDEVQAVAAAVRSALESDAQVVFTTGGASVGDFDFAAKTAGQLGAEPLFWKVNMKPGGALMASTWRDKLLVNLSGNPAAAMQLPDGTILTGKTSDLLGASSALLLNALKYLAHVSKEVKLISPEMIAPVMQLKTEYLGNRNSLLHINELLIILALEAQHNESAKAAYDCIPQLNSLEAHSSVILAQVDSQAFKTLGIHLTCEPVYENNKLFHK